MTARFLVVTVALALSVIVPPRSVSAQAADGLVLEDASGKARRAWPISGTPRVYVFTATGCPISNSYAPDYKRLHERFAKRGVELFAVNSGGEQAADVARHAKEFGFPFPVLLDPNQKLARLCRVTRTPEAALLDRGGALRYIGRVDDRWTSRTTKKRGADTHDLADAIESVLAGNRVKTRKTEAFGCAIVFDDAGAAATTRFTYHKDVAPILQRRCQRCHREGQVAPFELLSFEDAVSWKDEIVEFTHKGLMPPWKETGPRGRFAGDPRLTEEEKATLASWARGGAPEGDPNDAPKPLEWSEGWQLGKPDLVIEMPQRYELEASGPDVFRTFVIPLKNKGDWYVKAVEFQPDNDRVVHHMVCFLDNSGRAMAAQERDPKPGFESEGTGDFGFRVGILAIWAPGNPPRVWDDGVAMRLRPNTDLMLEMHYYKSGKPEKDRSRVGIYFAKKPVEKVIRIRGIENTRFTVPAGAKAHKVTARQRLRSAREIHTLFPHMHYIGKHMRLRARTPDKKMIELLNIRDWDFNWQLNYDLAKPVYLPKDTVLLLEAEFDNSSDNPSNLFDPPRAIDYGAKTTNEMCLVVLFESYPEQARSRR